MGRRRTVGYVENEWTCPNCHSRNKGSVKTCENCGAPQPENVQFELGAEQKMVTDAEKVKAAQAGADIHCGYCGARNPANAETCSQCGGDLKEGKAREAGRIMQAPAGAQVIRCKNCGTENPGSNSVCSNCGSPLPRAAQAVVAPPVTKGGLTPAAPLTGKKTNTKRNLFLLGGIFTCLAVACITIIILFLVPTSTVDGTVTSVHWQTNVPVQEIKEVQYTDRQGSPPSGAKDISCYTKESCTQETVDRGNGFSEVVETCTDTQYCSYTVDEWTTVQNYTKEGNNLQPVYENPNLASDQRLGNKTEELTVIFSTDDGNKTYKPGTVTEFQQYNIGSTWSLKLNLVGGVVSVDR
jgi:ribosomal protein L40E